MGEKIKYIWRRWRGNGSIIADVMKPEYYDYPKHRRKKPFLLKDVFVKEISAEQYFLEKKILACKDWQEKIKLTKEYSEKYEK